MGVRGPKPQPNALRRKAWQVRLPPSMERLAAAIAKRRGGSKSEHIIRALILYASIEEAEDAGLVEPD